MSPKKPLDDEDYPTTGHEWDGIREYDKPMPRWWLWTFYATVVWALGYALLYPAVPLFDRATPGMLGYSSREEVAAAIARAELANAPLDTRITSVALEEIGTDPDLARYARAGGGAIFRTYCSQCHGSGAAGAVGYPNLLDDDWLWGGGIEDIYLTIAHGIRDEDDFDSRFSEMPAFGEVLSRDEIAAVVAHLLKISDQTHDEALAGAGADIYLENCAACHGDGGAGDPTLGAPRLNDAIWLYGGDAETLTETVTYSRYGQMPPWIDRLSEAELRLVASYVHQLGGGQ
ncbi:MAG: cytochrome-c oxidase, cbb3-type subunit III [Pseudomonadota bacterium]